jgi:membrane protein DedA with SNARE-associated domain/membrane-associated phospholipid phosphatase/GT2 family glycosyltransferase
VIASFAAHLLALPAWVALLAVFALPALEASAFVGFVFPGEIALVLGGVVAYQGRVSLAAVLAAGVLGAVVGDSVGYAVGRRYGRSLLHGALGRWVKRDHLDRAERYLAARGGKAVLFGRFTAALRVMIPGLAGMSRMRYRTFLGFNVAGAVGWVTVTVLLGYVGGSSWRHASHLASRIGLAASAVLVLLVVATWLLRRHGGAGFERLAARLGSSPTLLRLRARYPRTTAWLLARLDPTRPGGLALTTAVAVAVAATWTFLGLTQDVYSHEEIALLDPGIHGWVVAHRVAALDPLFRAVTWLGANAVTVPVLAVAAALLVRRRRSWAPALDIAAVYGGVLLLHALVAQLVHRHRPPVADWIAPAHGWAYPSGHTAQAVAAWGVLALLVATTTRSPRVRALAAAGAAVLAVLVGLSRVYLGVHWATDVLGAAAMSVAVLAIWSAVRLSLPRPDAGGGPPPGRSSHLADEEDLDRSSLMSTSSTSGVPERPRAVVVVPTYQEAGNVVSVLDRVLAAAPYVDVLVVDDNSPDGTADLVAAHPRFSTVDPRAGGAARGRVHLLSRAGKEGLGAAYRAGFAWALARGYEAVVQMDADLSHPPERIPALLEALGTADVAVGSRYVPGGRVVNWPASRRLISRAGNGYVRWVLGVPVNDSTAGFKAMRRESLERIGAVDSASNGYCFQVENTWRAVRLGLRVVEVPITFTDRAVGASKMSADIVFEAMTRVLVWRWREVRPRRHHTATGAPLPGSGAP